jgi:thioredoxin reductase (NADPH)
LAKPIIMTLDDEPEVLNAIERDLRREYGDEFRVMKSASGTEALATLDKLHKRNSVVALFVADQRMPNVTGTEFLAQATEYYPQAKRVLLTAYADTQAAIDAINKVRLDHYLLKPWDPPEQHLYPILKDLLADWKSKVRLPFEGIRVAGATWSPSSHTAKHFLARNQIPYQWLDVDHDSKARKLVEDVSNGELLLPTIFLPDGAPLVEPTMQALAERVGLQTQAESKFYDIVIIGAGPAGLAAALYGATEGVGCLLIEKDAPGGQAGLSAKIDNYLGFPSGISGADLTRRALAQVKRFEVEVLTAQEGVGIRVEDPFRFVQLADGSEIACHAVIIATGAGYRQLNIPGIEEMTGTGVYYGAATTEAVTHRGHPMIVIGGANSAGQGAMFLAKYADPVYMIVRRPELKAAYYLQKALNSEPNIQIIYEADVVEFRGKEVLEGVVLQDVNTKEQRVIETPACFIFIGVAPRTDFVADLVLRDERGFVLTGPDLMQDGKPPQSWPLDRDPYLLESSVPGIFSVGDTRHGTKHRVAASVGDGGIAISMVHEYLKTV